MKKSPLQMVKEQFGTKEKLVDKVVELIEKGKEERTALRERLLTASNKKLLRLHSIGEEVKRRFGTKEKLVEAFLVLENRVKDLPYKEKLLTFSLPKLMDMLKGSEKRSRKGK